MPRIWVSVGFLPEGDVMALAPQIERLGYDGVSFPDHVFTPVGPAGRYPYSEDGKPPFAFDSPWPDGLVLSAAVGALTTDLQLMTAVQIMALRHPLLFAKAAATAARICGGRLTIGVGAGWQRDEFEALGVDFERRGELLNEAIDAVRRLWGEQPAEHAGRHYRFGPLQMEPTPPPIPIVVGGDSPAALRRAARLGDGWIAPTQPLAGIPAALERMRGALDDAGRDPATFRVCVPCLGANADQIGSILAPEVTDITGMPWPHPGKFETSVAEKVEHLEAWARDVMPALPAGASR